ncbi:thioredoxin family protein [Bacteroides intestinalis]|uniref:Thioredoxin n=1 Tax=Bacteroides intestinalis TaxID=329854 RepID=A0A139KML0_9BACE|nr:thioredoxin family protein [Bacteroides intestinalis]KXT40418.1 thioredoxin [Bacteroides intestinalis]
MEEKKEAREERNREKLANGDWVMAEFYASWCPHCKHMQPIVEEFKKAMEGTLEVVQVDIDQESALADFYTIEMYPTFILMRKGEQLWRQSGELPLERLEKAVKEYELKA